MFFIFFSQIEFQFLDYGGIVRQFYTLLEFYNFPIRGYRWIVSMKSNKLIFIYMYHEKTLSLSHYQNQEGVVVLDCRVEFSPIGQKLKFLTKVHSNCTFILVLLIWLELSLGKSTVVNQCFSFIRTFFCQSTTWFLCIVLDKTPLLVVRY